MSKLSFRARALDASKPLPVFRCEDLPDLHEYASINRAVPQMPTGMEKEEESVCFCFVFVFFYRRLTGSVRRRFHIEAPLVSPAQGKAGSKMAAITAPFATHTHTRRELDEHRV